MSLTNEDYNGLSSCFSGITPVKIIDVKSAIDSQYSYYGTLDHNIFTEIFCLLQQHTFRKILTG